MTRPEPDDPLSDVVPPLPPDEVLVEGDPLPWLSCTRIMPFGSPASAFGATAAFGAARSGLLSPRAASTGRLRSPTGASPPFAAATVLAKAPPPWFSIWP